MPVFLNNTFKFWDGYKKQTVPAPLDAATPHVDWWYNKTAKNAGAYRQAGFATVLMPPPCKTQGGAANDADGYGLLDPYDLGNKQQSYNRRTRFGSLEEARRCIAILRANGLNAAIDYVFHQRNGGNNGHYHFPSATGPTNGRWPLSPSCFAGAPPRVPGDPVFSEEGNYAFGDACSYVHSKPADYMANEAVRNLDWIIRTLGITGGVRLDDVKGSNSAFVYRLATSGAMGKLYKFGECFDGNPQTLDNWVNSVHQSCSAIDFTLHFALQRVCDQGAGAALLLDPNAAYFKWNPFKSATYVESPDTDNSPGQQITNCKGLAYWFLLTSEGQPTVYYRDWASDAHCYNLAPLINNLNWIHENLAFGTTLARYGDQSVCCFERTGFPGLLTAGNWDTWNKRTLTVPAHFGPNTWLHDYSGHAPDIRTDSQGRATFTIPANAYRKGQSYVCYSRPGYSQPFPLDRKSTTQEFFGADDLDIGPAVAGSTLTAGRIWCDASTKIEINPGAGAKDLKIGVRNPEGSPVDLSQEKAAFAARRGYYTLTVTADATIAPQRFDFSATYTATQDLHDKEV